MRLGNGHASEAVACGPLVDDLPDPACVIAGGSSSMCALHWTRRGDVPATNMDCAGEVLVGQGGLACDPEIASPRTMPRGSGAQRIEWATVVRAGGAHVRTYYADAAGRPVRVVEATGDTTDRNYDGAGRLTGTRGAAGVRTCMAFDKRWNETLRTILPRPDRWVSDERIVQAFLHDDGGRLLEASLPNAPQTAHLRIERDNRGNMTRLEYPGTGLQWTFVPDSRGRMWSETSPGGHVARYEYGDPTGRATRVEEDFGGTYPIVTTTQHDARGRVTRVQRAGAPTVWNQWSPAGFLEWSERDIDLDPSTPVIRTNYGRGPLGRLAVAVEPGREVALAETPRGLLAYSLETSPDAPGRMRARCLHYNARGLLDEHVDPTGRRTRWVHDAAGQVVRVDRGVWATSGTWDAPCAGTEAAALPPASETTWSGQFEDGLLIWEEIGAPGATPPWQFTYNHDGYGRLVERIHPNGVRERYGYRADGLLSWQATYGAGVTDLPTGPASYQPSLTDGALIALTFLDYDQAGRPTERRDAWFHDDPAAGRVLLGDAGWITSSTAYDDASSETRVTDAEGHTTVTRVDAHGRLSWEAHATASTLNVTYSADGLIETRTYAPAPTAEGTYVESTERTPWGAVARETQGAGEPANLIVHHDEFGRPVELIERHQSVQYWYDGMGDRVAIGRSGGSGYEVVWEIEHDEGAAIRRMYDSSGAEWLYHRDALGRVVMEKRPRLDSSTYSYRPGTDALRRIDNPDGWMEASYDAGGQIAQWLGHRPSSAPAWREARVTFTHGPRGLEAMTSFNRTDTSADDVTYTMSRDSLGRVRRQGSHEFAPTPLEVQSSARGLTSDITMGSRHLEYSYDGLGRRRGAHVNGAMAYAVTYDGVGRPTLIERANGVTESVTYDAALRGRQHNASANGSSKFEHEVFWSSRGQPARVDRWWANASGPVSDLMRSDESGRVSGAWYGLPSLASAAGTSGAITDTMIQQWLMGATVTRSDTWSWNTVDEVESHAADGLQIQPTYGADHRLESWNVAVSNDVMGRLLSDGVRTYGYDGLGRQVTVTEAGSTTELRLDALGRLASWTAGAGQAKGALEYDDHGSIVRERRDGLPDQLYVGGWALAPAALVQGGGTLQLHASHDERVHYVSDAAAAIVERVDWRASGSLRVATAAGFKANSQQGVRALYLGAPYFGGFEAHRLGARWYRPGWGQFSSMDPLGTVDGPNPFVYAAGRPHSSIDPSGLALEPIAQSLPDSLRPLAAGAYGLVVIAIQIGGTIDTVLDRNDMTLDRRDRLMAAYRAKGAQYSRAVEHITEAVGTTVVLRRPLGLLPAQSAVTPGASLVHAKKPPIPGTGPSGAAPAPTAPEVAAGTPAAPAAGVGATGGAPALSGAATRSAATPLGRSIETLKQTLTRGDGPWKRVTAHAEGATSPSKRLQGATSMEEVFVHQQTGQRLIRHTISKGGELIHETFRPSAKFGLE